MQWSLDVADQVRESGRQVAHQQDDCREAGGAERGQEEKETNPPSCRAELHLLFQVELWSPELPRYQLQETTSLLSRDQARRGLSGQTPGSPAQRPRLQEIKKEPASPALPSPAV